MGNPTSIVYPSVEAAWRDALSIVHEVGADVAGTNDPLSIGSSFGLQPRPFREMIGVTIEISNPRDRLIKSSAKPVNIAYLLGNVVWTVIGSDEVSHITYYNKRGWAFTDDQVTVAAAPGKRVFQSSHGDQFAKTARLLQLDPATRRAVIAIYTPSDVGSTHRDCSCLLTMQFLIRDGRLICVAGMRSQSLAMVFPYDAFLLTMLHEAMAVATATEVGALILQYGSLHYYHDEVEIVSAILAERAQPLDPMPNMEKPLSEVQDFLASVDSAIRSHKAFSVKNSPGRYWETFGCSLKHAVAHRESPIPLPVNLQGTWYASLTE